MGKDEKQRKKNYDRLRAVGFNSYEATTMKDYGQKRLNKIIEEKKKSNEAIENLKPQK